MNITFFNRQVHNPVLKALVILIMIAAAIVFIPLFIVAAIIGLIAYCFGMPATVKINGEVRKYRWFWRIA